MDDLARRTLETQSDMLLMDWYHATYGPFRATSGGELLEMVEAAKIVEAKAADTTKKWVQLARAAGLGCTELALTLGMTKQKIAHQYPVEKTSKPALRPGYTVRETLLVHHDFILEQEGRRRRRLVEVTPSYLVFEQTDRNWEYHRASISADPSFIKGMRDAGYDPICNSGPFCISAGKCPQSSDLSRQPAACRRNPICLEANAQPG